MRVGLGATAVGLFLFVLLLPLLASRGAVQARGTGKGDEAVYLPLIMHLLSPRNIATPTATTTFATVRVSVVSDGTQGNGEPLVIHLFLLTAVMQPSSLWPVTWLPMIPMAFGMFSSMIGDNNAADIRF